ncbi:GRAM domain-containing protein 2B-like [Neosynchiropus ocellatus]
MALVSEQVERPLTPLPPADLVSQEARGSRKAECEDRKTPRRRETSLADPRVDTEESQLRRLTGVQLKPVEHLSTPLTPSDCEVKFEVKRSQSSQLSKANTHFHKLFKEVGRDEPLRQSYTCALQKDMLYQGKMFVSDSWICFHSRVFGRDTKISIPVTAVTFIKKTKTALLVPNALVVETSSEQHVFVSFLSRNATFRLLKSVCAHLEVENSSSPLVSSCEHSFRVGSSSLPLFPADFSQLDGVVRRRRQDMMESSSSGSRTPDYDKASVEPRVSSTLTLVCVADFGALPDSFLDAVKSAEVSVHADVHLQNSGQNHGPVLKNGPAKPSRTHREKSSQAGSLHLLLLIYLFLVSLLVVSTCYMALKIVALEHRLDSLLSLGQDLQNRQSSSGQTQDELNAEIYGELSTNLFKLEKIQRNLRKLLQT